MSNAVRRKGLSVQPLMLGAALLFACNSSVHAASRGSRILPTGQVVTPTAAGGSKFSPLNPGLPDNLRFIAGQPVSEALSPDRKTLLVLTSGYNRQRDAKGKVIGSDSHEYVFVFDVRSGFAVRKQVLQLPNTYVGIAFAPSANRFVVSGGTDDTLHVFDYVGTQWNESGTSPVKLGHTAGIGIKQGAMVQGVAVTADGTLAVVANRYNASITTVSLTTGKIMREIDLRSQRSAANDTEDLGGEFPNSVCILGSETAFVSSERDREIVVVDLPTGAVTARVSVSGNPNKMILSRDASRLYVAVDNADVIAVVDTRERTLVEEIATVAPEGMLHLAKHYRGASPNALALSPDERTLFVTNRGTNSVAVISLDTQKSSVRGLIPTGWYPSDVVVGPKDILYVVNTQGVPGPNRGYCAGYQTIPCPVANTPVHPLPNEYILSQQKGGLLSVPIPQAQDLKSLTRRVAKNNHFDTANRYSDVMAALHDKIKHVIYIIKENRTYDQVLGDIGRGNSDPRLAEFPFATTPNLHDLANQFVLLDNFYDSGNVSGNGWPWSTAARESDAGAKMMPVNYAKRGGSYDWEGTNSNVNVGLTGAARSLADPLSDTDALPGTHNIAAPDGPDGEVQQGYLWDSALRAGLRVRNYGFMIDLTRYSAELLLSPPGAQLYIPLEINPYAKHLTVSYAANPELVSRTDEFFRGFDPAFPDTYRELEWAREFHAFSAGGDLPALSLVRFMGDHTGSFSRAISGINTPELQVADNDFAVGKLVETVARSPFAKDTLIFIVEDDAQDGPDHVDAHRSTAYIVGPYVKRGAVISLHFTTVNILRTITDVLDIDHLSLFDATQRPMIDVFDLQQPDWAYRAEVSSLLMGSEVTLPIPSGTKVAGELRQPTHTANYWAKRTEGMDFTSEDKIEPADYNRVLWRGLMGKRPYPTARSGTNLAAPTASGK